MKRREQYKRIIMFFSSAMLLVTQTCIFAYVWFVYYADSDIIGVLFWRRGNYVVIGQYALMTFFFYKIYGGYKVGYLRVFDVLYSQILAVVCANAITYLQLSLIGRWKFLTYIKPILIITGIDLIVVIIWIFFMRWIYAIIYPPRKMLLIYGKYDPELLIKKISSRKDKYVICEKMHIDAGTEIIMNKIDQYEAIVLGDIPSKIRNVLLKYCFEKDIRCYSVPKISDIMIRSAEDLHLFDAPLLLFRNKGLNAEQKFVKRLFDILFSSVGIVVTSPIMLIIAILVKCCDHGPVLYQQIRLTQNGRTFKLFKFRSMYVDSSRKGVQLTRKNDDRITPVGKVLRNIHFDELPQLFNILKGDMSFVGPRPECVDVNKEYSEIIPEFTYRLKVKAGLTGFAQVFGKYNTTPYDKLKLDLTYIENYSIWLDFKLIIMTVKILFQKETVDGIEDWQKTAATKENLKKIGKSTENERV